MTHHQLLGALTLAACIALAALFIPSRKRRLPLSERLCERLFRAAAWLERLARAFDAAILRYRLERAQVVIDMQSTVEREARRAA